jgi:ribosomal protein L30E
MATSIFFTESKDFKLIKDRILNHEDNYLVYVYADTSNIRIPRELIMELPKYGNNLIWVDTYGMDSADLSHHIVLTIGQLINPEEAIDFFIVSKTSKLEKTILFLRNQGIPAEMISPEKGDVKPEKAKGTGRRGRPKKVKAEEAGPVKGKRGRPKKVKAEEATPVIKGKRGRPKKVKTEETVQVIKGKRGRPKKVKTEPETAPSMEAIVKTGKRGRPRKGQLELPSINETVEIPKKKRGRPRLFKEDVADLVLTEPKKRGRKKKEQPLTEEKPKRGLKPSTKKEAKQKKQSLKKVKLVSETKPRKQRVDREINAETVKEKLQQYATTDANLGMVMTELFWMKKVARPKFEGKLIEKIKSITLEDDTTAERIIEQLQEMRILQSTGKGGRVFYKD